MMQVIPGSSRWYCRVEGCGKFTRHNISFGYCDEHTRSLLNGEQLASKLGFPPMGSRVDQAVSVDAGATLSVQGATESAQESSSLLTSHTRLRTALEELIGIIDAAGLLNLSNEVQLGQTSWYVKASDRLEEAREALTAIPGSSS